MPEDQKEAAKNVHDVLAGEKPQDDSKTKVAVPGDQKKEGKNIHDVLAGEKPQDDDKTKAAVPTLPIASKEENKEKDKENVLATEKPEVGPTPGKP